MPGIAPCSCPVPEACCWASFCCWPLRLEAVSIAATMNKGMSKAMNKREILRKIFIKGPLQYPTRELAKSFDAKDACADFLNTNRQNPFAGPAGQAVSRRGRIRATLRLG